MSWCGSKSCKKKDLLSPQWLRNIKDKKYPFWRIDTIFSKKKYNNIHFVNNGGWHFSNIKTPEKIHQKLKTSLHHYEYEQSNIGPKEINQMINQRKPVYELQKNSSEAKDRAHTSLKITGLENLPSYIQENKKKFEQWIIRN